LGIYFGFILAFSFLKSAELLFAPRFFALFTSNEQNKSNICNFSKNLYFLDKHRHSVSSRQEKADL